MGEWIEAFLERPTSVAHVELSTGWDYADARRDLWMLNQRMATFQIEYDGGRRSFTVPSGQREFDAGLDGVTTTRIRITCTAVQGGPTRWEDLAISEVRVIGGLSAGSEASLAPVPSGSGLDRTEVTVNSYGGCVTTGACSPAGTGPGCNTGQPGHGLHPVNCVDANQAAVYCRWAGGRMPSGSEWETEARGASNRTYPWGEEPPDCTRADFTPTGNADGSCGGAGTSPVGGHPLGATPEGIQDLAGNVWEWTSDAGDQEGTHIVRGGTWGSPAPELLTGSTRSVAADARRPGIGIRCAR